MTKPTYPTDIVTDDGWARIHQGHGIARDVLSDDLGRHQPDDREPELHVTEAHFHYMPRVKRCSDYDGYGCDQEGEWHAHWFEVKPGPGTAFTLARWAKPWEES